MKWLLAIPMALMTGVIYLFTTIIPTIIGAIAGLILGIKGKKEKTK